jgi:alpha-tubulin suppressor-like RCC1 family protein
VKRGAVVQQYDVSSLAPLGDPQTTPGEISGAEVSPSGVFWVTNAQGRLRSYRGGRIATDVSVGDAADATLVLAGESPVLVDLRRHTARLVDPSTGGESRELCFDWNGSSKPLLAAASPAGWVAAVNDDVGELVVSRTGSRACEPIILDGDARDQYGTPVVKDGWVYVPDFTSGDVVVVDPDRRDDPIVKRVNINLAGQQVRLTSANQHVWFDEPDGDRVGVISDDLVALSVSKTDAVGAVTSSTPTSDDNSPQRVSCTFTPRYPQPGDTVTFTAGLVDTSKQARSYTWHFPGGTPPSAQGAQTASRFPDRGQRQVSVTADTATDQLTGSCSVDIGAHPPRSGSAAQPGQPPSLAQPNQPSASTPQTLPPTNVAPATAGAKADFTWTEATSVGTPITFRNTSTGTWTSGSWRFEGGSPSTSSQPSPSITYTAPGTYNVTLDLTTPTGTQTATKTITIVATTTPGGGSTSPPSAVRQVSAGGYHTCALVTNGTVTCWGDRSNGYANRTPVAGLTGVAQLANGYYFTCALESNRTVTCWGRNDAGQLGNTTNNYNGTNSPSMASVPPMAVAGLSGVTQIAAGGAHTCALLTNGTVTCWGYNYSGELGNPNNKGATIANPTPTLVTGLSGATQISAGDNHTCALLTNGTVTCWGDNQYGELGNTTNNGTDAANPAPAVVTGLTGVAHVSAGGGHTCALLTNATVACWGGNGFGELGNAANNGTTNASPTPTAVAGLTGVTQITTGQDHTCALLTNGTMTCWGYNRSGELGNSATNGTTNANPTPTVVAGLTGVTQITSGFGHTCALATNGSVTCWGDNQSGELGNPTNNGTTNPNPTPTVVAGLP